MSKKRWDFKNSPLVSDVKKTARKTGEALGLYPEEEQQKQSQPVKRLCGTEDCTISGIHRHPTVPVIKRDAEVSQSRSSHFDIGSQEHLPKNVVSMSAFKASKAAKRPEGY